LYILPIYSIPTLIEYVSSIMKLETGDVILTGTPKGVGAIHAGDVITAGLCPGNRESDIVHMKFNAIDRIGGFAKA
jgi:acylpyruvate hydrolase